MLVDNWTGTKGKAFCQFHISVTFLALMKLSMHNHKLTCKTSVTFLPLELKKKSFWIFSGTVIPSPVIFTVCALLYNMILYCFIHLHNKYYNINHSNIVYIGFIYHCYMLYLEPPSSTLLNISHVTETYLC